MEQFKPVIGILAVDESDVVVTFDFASASDVGRSPKALRIPRKFSELSVVVAPFEVLGSSDERKEYRGAIKLVVKSQSDETVEHTLAEPRLWLAAEGRPRKRGAAPNFYSSDAVTAAVRVGVAGALSNALATFFGNETHIDALTRSPARVAAEGMLAAAGGDHRSAPPPPFRAAAASVIPTNDEPSSGRFSKKKVFLAIAAAPVVVFGLLAAGGSLKKSDPIQEAVASAMAHNPSSTQAQVELTKETLKQMGLDPGKSGDIGCLAPN